MDKLDSFNVLLDEEYEIAKTLHQTGESLGCNIVFKTRPNGYRVIINKQSNRKVLFWPRDNREYSGKFIVRVPKSLHRQLDRLADREGVSLNQYLVSELSKVVGTEGAKNLKG
jgi:hypothetical protein